MANTSQRNYTDAQEAADYIRSRFSSPIQVAVLTGTGLGGCFTSIQAQTTLEYEEIPHFPISTAPSHDGRLVMGELAGKGWVIMQGRCHLYEGYSAQTVTFPLRVMQALGIKIVFITNASGGLNPLYTAGDIMVIEDHINLTGSNPLIGSNDRRWGPRFPEMTHAYNQYLRGLAQDAASRLKVKVQKGIYAGLVGPSLETAAEMQFLRTIGADAVGFSTVMETIAAVHADMNVLGLSVITNMCLPDALVPADVEAIMTVAREAAPRIEAILTDVVIHLNDDSCHTLRKNI